MKIVENKWSTLHFVERTAKFHAEFVKIHPFIDENERTFLPLLMNYELMKAGFPLLLSKQLIVQIITMLWIMLIEKVKANYLSISEKLC